MRIKLIYRFLWALGFLFCSSAVEQRWSNFREINSQAYKIEHFNTFDSVGDRKEEILKFSPPPHEQVQYERDTRSTPAKDTKKSGAENKTDAISQIRWTSYLLIFIVIAIVILVFILIAFLIFFVM